MLKRGLLVVFLLLLAVFVNAEKQGDFNNDGCVNELDTTEFNNHINSENGQDNYDVKYDFDNNSVIDFPDFVFLASLVGQDSVCVFVQSVVEVLEESPDELLIGDFNN